MLLKNTVRKMSNHSVLGIDTSNYTTSSALYENGQMFMEKLLLPVEEGHRGLRQSDAVFLHTKQLPLVLSGLPLKDKKINAIGVSVSPRDMEDSYMPVFTVGENLAKILSDIFSASLYKFSHQAGHIAAALYSAQRLDLLNEKFIAFHLSGGTTEAVLVEPDSEKIIKAKIIAESLDLKAGQAVDRCGVMMGLSFPAGKEISDLALLWDEKIKYTPSMKGANVSLSGIENKYRKMFEENEPKEKIARFCIEAVCESVSKMCEKLLLEYGEMPVLFAGGVSSSVIIKEKLSKKFGAIFALPQYSQDNAAGVAVLASEAMKRGILPW